MTEQGPASPSPSPPSFRPTEYLAALLAVLLALLLAGWYVSQWLSREPRPTGEQREPALRFRPEASTQKDTD